MAGLTREQRAAREAEKAVAPAQDNRRAEWLNIAVQIAIAKLPTERNLRQPWELADDLIAHADRRFGGK